MVTVRASRRSWVADRGAGADGGEESCGIEVTAEVRAYTCLTIFCWKAVEVSSSSCSAGRLGLVHNWRR